MSASAIWRLSRRGTRPGQQPVLDRLVVHGLVAASPAAVGNLYSLNRDHLLAAAVLTAARARTKLVERLRQRLDSLAPHPLHALLFGSFVRGEADERSDIDLLIVVPDDVDPRAEEWNEQVDAIVDDVERWTGNPLQVLTHTARSLQKLISTDEPIVDGWRRDSVRLLGAEADVLFAKNSVA